MDDFSPAQIFSLLNQIAQGDDQALVTLYKHYQRPLFAFVRHLVLADEAAEDIVIDTFLAVRKTPLGFDGSCRFFTWLCSIAKHKHQDWLRKRNRQQRLDVEEWDEQLAETTALDWDVVSHFEDLELADLMRGCIDQLPQPQREALYWVYYQDAKLETVAQIQTSPVNTIKTRLLHARLKVRECLEKLGAGR